MLDYTTKKDISQALAKKGVEKLMQKKINEILKNHLTEQKQHGKAKRVEECSSHLSFKIWHDEKQTAKLHTINLCRERLCANCSTALARKKFFELQHAFEGVTGVKFITLTVDNVFGWQLRETLKKMQKALKAMLRKFEIDFYFRSFEITYNNAKNTYHPHIHLLIKTENFLANKKVREVWSEEIHKAGIHTKHAWLSAKVENLESEKGYMELCKYVTKPSDVSAETVKILEPAVKGLQLKRGSKKVTDKFKEFRADTKKARQEEERRLDLYGWDIELYLWNDTHYIKAMP